MSLIALSLKEQGRTQIAKQFALEIDVFCLTKHPQSNGLGLGS